MNKTSQTHPLRIESVAVPGTAGAIGMTFCPGKVQPNALSGSWARGLDTDLHAIQNWGAVALVSLMEQHEYRELGVADLPNRLPGGMQYFQLPIPDGGVPDTQWEKQWEDAGKHIRALLGLGKKIVIHCKGGLGRTGLLAARLLVEFGMRADHAVEAVRKARPGTIENSAQEEYVYRQLPVDGRLFKKPSHVIAPDRANRYRGCLLGGAVGDALGATVEFMDLSAIHRQFGAGGIQDFVPAYGRVGAITDDTQMMLFTAEGVLRAQVRGVCRGICYLPGVVHHAYLRWLRTQEKGTALPEEPILDGWLITHRELFSPRAPGNTCLAALRAAGGFGTPAINDRKGCGGVMRVAPVGLYAATVHTDAGETFRWGCETAALTHGHPTGQLPAGVLAVLIRELAGGGALGDALVTAKKLLREQPRHEETMVAIEKAERLAASTAPAEEGLPQLGEGWIAEEALAIALFCALRAKSLEDGITMAVNITGDSDSTGAIAGNLLGAILGADQIPPRWLDSLELKDVIVEMADDLATVNKWPLTSDSRGQTEEEMAESAYLWAKYPGW